MKNGIGNGGSAEDDKYNGRKLILEICARRSKETPRDQMVILIINLKRQLYILHNIQYIENSNPDLTENCTIICWVENEDAC